MDELITTPYFSLLILKLVDNNIPVGKESASLIRSFMFKRLEDSDMRVKLFTYLADELSKYDDDNIILGLSLFLHADRYIFNDLPNSKYNENSVHEVIYIISSDYFILLLDQLADIDISDQVLNYFKYYYCLLKSDVKKSLFFNSIMQSCIPLFSVDSKLVLTYFA